MDFGELLGVVFWGHVVTLGVIFDVFGASEWGCISDLVLGWFLEGFGVTRHAKTLIPCDRCIKFMEITNL